MRIENSKNLDTFPRKKILTRNGILCSHEEKTLLKSVRYICIYRGEIG